MRVGEEHEEHDAADAAECEPERRRDVAVLRRQCARGQSSDQLREGRGDEPRQGLGGHVSGVLRQTASDQLAPEIREDPGDHGRRNGDCHERERVGAELRAEPPFGLGAREVRDDDHPEGLGAEDEHEVDAVGGHEAVRLAVPPELVREESACHRGGQAQGHIREPGEGAASHGAPAASRATLGLLVGEHRCMKADDHDSTWTDAAVADLRREFADYFSGRTCLVTGADGFMGSHLTEALVQLDANVHAFVRATSSGALNNIVAPAGAAQGPLRRPDRQDVDRLPGQELLHAPDKPYVFHLGAQAHVGESWHRPYETMMANTVGTLNLLQSIVDHGLELEKFDTAGTSEEYGNVARGGRAPPRLR